MSDHLQVYAVLKLKTTKLFAEPLITVLANNSRQLLSIFSGDHVNTKLHIFNNVPQSTLDSHAPIITREVRSRPCPLVSGGIKELMRLEIGSTIAYSCHETLNFNKGSRNADNESPLDMSWCDGHNQSYFQQWRMELILNLHFRPISFNLHMIVFFFLCRILAVNKAKLAVFAAALIFLIRSNVGKMAGNRDSKFTCYRSIRYQRYSIVICISNV